MLIGLVFNEIINIILKQTIQQTRPTFDQNGPVKAKFVGISRSTENEINSNIKHDGYGMPSSHAQFVAFWAAYLYLIKAPHWPFAVVFAMMVSLSR